MAYQQPPQPQGASGASHGASTFISALGSDVAAGLTYVIGIIPCVGLVLQIVVFFVEKNRFVKFHAAQVLLLSIVGFVLGGILDGVNVAIGGASNGGSSGLAGFGVTGCIGGIVGIVIFGFWLWGMISAFTGRATKLPLIGGWAEAWAGGPVENEGL